MKQTFAVVAGQMRYAFPSVETTLNKESWEGW